MRVCSCGGIVRQSAGPPKSAGRKSDSESDARSCGTDPILSTQRFPRGRDPDFIYTKILRGRDPDFIYTNFIVFPHKKRLLPTFKTFKKSSNILQHFAAFFQNFWVFRVFCVAYFFRSFLFRLRSKRQYS